MYTFIFNVSYKQHLTNFNKTIDWAHRYKVERVSSYEEAFAEVQTESMKYFADKSIFPEGYQISFLKKITHSF